MALTNEVSPFLFLPMETNMAPWGRARRWTTLSARSFESSSSYKTSAATMISNLPRTVKGDVLQREYCPWKDQKYSCQCFVEVLEHTALSLKVQLILRPATRGRCQPSRNQLPVLKRGIFGGSFEENVSYFQTFLQGQCCHPRQLCPKRCSFVPR